MADVSDMDLMEEYAARNSEAAFAGLVRRHINLVYSVALRSTGNAADAQDVAQSVFILLAHKAASLRQRITLTGWLYETTRLVARQRLRTQARQRARDQEAYMQSTLNQAGADNLWQQLAPLLEEGMMRLSENERALVALRFYENKTAAETAALLGIQEWAAHKRVNRAVEKLRTFFARRGLMLSTTALTSAIAANSVQSAPVGLAASVTAAALSGASITTTAIIAATKTIVMTTLQKTLVTVTVAALAGAGIYEARQAAQLRAQNQSLQQQQAAQIEQLQQERDDAMKRLAFLSARPAPHLPAPPMQVTASTNAIAGDVPATNLFSRFKDEAPKLTSEQVEAYLKANGRKASALLAAFRTSGDPALLKEAMEKFPNDPQVAFEAALDKNLSPEQQRQWLNAFEKSAPDNALANYLSAFNDFNSGQIDQGIQELTAASGKGFNDYTLARAQDDEEAYLSAGYTAAEAERISDSSLMLSQLPQVKQLGVDLVDLAKAYNQSGDPASAQAAFQMAMSLGQRYTDSSTDPMLINQLVGIAIEKIALTAMDPNSPFGNNGQTVQDQLNQITQNRAAISALVQQAQPFLPMMSDQDILNYENRRRAMGEVAALQWVVTKYGSQ